MAKCWLNHQLNGSSPGISLGTWVKMLNQTWLRWGDRKLLRLSRIGSLGFSRGRLINGSTRWGFSIEKYHKEFQVPSDSIMDYMVPFMIRMKLMKNAFFFHSYLIHYIQYYGSFSINHIMRDTYDSSIGTWVLEDHSKTPWPWNSFRSPIKLGRFWADFDHLNLGNPVTHYRNVIIMLFIFFNWWIVLLTCSFFHENMWDHYL